MLTKPILYFTRRKPKFERGVLTFKNEVQNELIFGVCDVLVDPQHNNSNLSRTMIYMSPEPIDHPTLTYYNFSNQVGFEDLQAVDPDVLLNDNYQSLLLFIHGYNANFKTPIEVLASLGKGVDWNGTLCCYCWPSKNSSFAYFSDKRLVDLEEIHHLKKLLELLALGKSPFRQVTILAHSMGNHLLFETMAICASLKAQNNSRPFLLNIVAAHANIPRNRFKEIVTECSWMSTHWHAFGDSRDLPLMLARINLHGKQLGIPGNEEYLIETAAGKTKIHYITTNNLLLPSLFLFLLTVFLRALAALKFLPK